MKILFILHDNALSVYLSVDVSFPILFILVHVLFEKVLDLSLFYPLQVPHKYLKPTYHRQACNVFILSNWKKYSSSELLVYVY